MTGRGEQDFTVSGLTASFAMRGANFHTTLGNIGNRTRELHGLFDELQRCDDFGMTEFPLGVSAAGAFEGGRVYREMEEVGRNKFYRLGTAGVNGAAVELCSFGYDSGVTATVRRPLTDEEKKLGNTDGKRGKKATVHVRPRLGELVAEGALYNLSGDQVVSTLAQIFAGLHSAIVQASDVYPLVQEVREREQRLGTDATEQAIRGIVSPLPKPYRPC